MHDARIHPAEAQALLSMSVEPTREAVVSVFDLLPDEGSGRGPSHSSSHSFVTGAWVHGNMTGVRKNVTLYPNAVKLFASFMCAHAPASFKFSSIAIFRNIHADFHFDRNNLAASVNAVFPLSCFQRGGIWYEAPNGTVARVFSGKTLLGHVLDVSSGVVLFNAREQRHCTMPWDGDRTILVAFCTRGSDCLDAAHSSALSQLGFRLPTPGVDLRDLCTSPQFSPSAERAKTACNAPIPVSSSSLFVEVFAGCARLSSAFEASGVRSLAVDGPRNEHVPECCLWTLDLVQPICQRLFLARLDHEPVYAIHFGLPCGTGSRARERKVAPRLVAAGAPTPRPLRSADHVLGIPGISAVDQAKVDASNVLSAFCVDIMRLAFRRGWKVTVENPTRSWLWAVLAHYVRLTKDEPFISWYCHLFVIDFDVCMHGGSRDKRTRFLTSAQELCHLALDCDKSHKHQSWSARKLESIWTFDTKTEAEYPLLLCQRYAAALCSHPVPATHSKPLLRQSRRQPPLVPEYKCFLKHAPDSADFRQLDLGLGKSGSGSTFAVYHSKQEFVDKAISAGHPFLEARPIDDMLKRNAFFILTEGLSSVAKFRISSIQKLSQMKQELANEERRYQATLPLHVQQVLKGKSVLLWKKLLDDTGFPDKGVKDLIEGVALVGKPSKSELYGWKEVPATTSVEDLLASTPWKNSEVASRGDPTVSPVSVKALWDITVDEVTKGYLEGPFDDLESVRTRLGVPSVCVSRRFLLEQGSPNAPKQRPIDDYRESGVNSAYHALDKLALHDVDYMAHVCQSIALAVSGREVTFVLSNGEKLEGTLHRDFWNGVAWQGRCLDLERAYRQVPVMESNLRFSVIAVQHPTDGRPKYFLSNSLPFGAGASVFGFNRISRSLLHLSLHYGKVIGGVFYDDIPLLEPKLTSRLCSLTIEGILDILGWSYSRDPTKYKPFSETFSLLGMQLNVGSLSEGFITLSNKESRVNNLLEEACRLKQEGTLSRALASSLRGKLNFMNSFVAGRCLKTACRALANVAHGPRIPALSELKSLGSCMESCLRKLAARVIHVGKAIPPLIVFTDAAYESGTATWGIVCIDLHSGTRFVSGGNIPDAVITSWQEDGSSQIIAQAEAFALLLARRVCKHLLKDRLVTFYIDNESTRFAVIRGSSPCRSLLHIVTQFLECELEDGAIPWVERVPSASNIADLPTKPPGLKLLSAW